MRCFFVPDSSPGCVPCSRPGRKGWRGGCCAYLCRLTWPALASQAAPLPLEPFHRAAEPPQKAWRCGCPSSPRLTGRVLGWGHVGCSQSKLVQCLAGAWVVTQTPCGLEFRALMTFFVCDTTLVSKELETAIQTS